ncbi:MAG: ATP-binding protein [Anaerolineae bacterium]|nr:ATP-binding protein [Anaerolineae bacterium]
MTISRQEGLLPALEQEPTITVSIPAAFQYLNVVGEAIRALLERAVEADRKDEFVNSVELAVHETCTNIVKHAYDSDGGRIVVALTLADNPRRVVADTYDTGRSFDLLDVQEPDLDAVQERGYGLFLIQNLVDDVSYHANDDGNRWRLVKRID